MLSKDEEQRLEDIIEEVGTESWGLYPEADFTEFKWLISKLKNLNDEVKELNAENNLLCTENTELVFEMLKMKMRPKDAG